jgi:arylformamidase
MKIYDVSVPLQSGMPVWPGDDPPRFEQHAFIEKGSIVNSTAVHSSAHVGTHVDAPRHLFNEGKTIDEISLDILVGPAEVIDMQEASQIDRRVLSSIPMPPCVRLLFKTRNSNHWGTPHHKFKKDFVSLTGDGAEFLIEKGIRLVGIDYLSIDLFSAGDLPAHKILLENEVVVIEGLDLSGVVSGQYELNCLPLKIVGADGAPARVILKSMVEE